MECARIQGDVVGKLCCMAPSSSWQDYTSRVNSVYVEARDVDECQDPSSPITFARQGHLQQEKVRFEGPVPAQLDKTTSILGLLLPSSVDFVSFARPPYALKAC